MTSGNEYISKNLRYIRKANKLTQQEMADAMKVSRGQLASYEKGVTPRLSFIAAFANYFNISLDELILEDLEHKSASGGNADTTPTSLVQDPGATYQNLGNTLREKERLIKILREQLRDKEKIIHFLEEKLKAYE